MTYGEFMELAKKNYDKGGKYVMECWNEQSFKDYEEMFTPMTEETAMRIFKSYWNQKHGLVACED